VLNDIFTQRDQEVLPSLKIITKIFTGKSIVCLDISNNAIAPTGCQALYELIKSCTSLQYLWANNCGLAQVRSSHD
jgi:Ran GTPase-activating protein (RanGAP) involved in mRNA processing and transport